MASIGRRVSKSPTHAATACESEHAHAATADIPTPKCQIPSTKSKINHNVLTIRAVAPQKAL